MGERFSQPFDLVLGRKTYEIFAAYWPYQAGEIADPFNACTKYVATRSDREFTWNNTTPLRGDAAAEIARLKQGEGPNLLTQGSTNLLQTLLSHGLVDEFWLLVFPLVLGKGKRLFGEGTVPAGLKLAGSKVSSTGVIISTYLPAGEVQTGSFAMDEPSEAELKRRREWAAEG